MICGHDDQHDILFCTNNFAMHQLQLGQASHQGLSRARTTAQPRLEGTSETPEAILLVYSSINTECNSSKHI